MILLLLVLFLFLLFLYLPSTVKFIRKQVHMRRMMRGVPGPNPHPIFGNLKQIPLANTEWTDWFVGLGKDWLPKGRNTIPLWIFTQLKIVCLNGESVQDILDCFEEITKSDDYDMIEHWLGKALLILTGERWKTRRRILTPTFHFQMLEGYIKSFNREAKILTDILMPYSLESVEQFDLHPFVKRFTLDIICGLNRYYDRTIKVLTDFTKQVIADRKKDIEINGFKEDGKRKAFLVMLREMRTQNSLTDEDIRQEVDAFMWEGEKVQQKVADELYDIFGCMMCPAGSMVLISPFIIHRNEQVYPEPLKFDPDRFLPENTFTRHAFDYRPFSTGQRNCIGQKFAMHDQKVVVAWMIRKFKLLSDQHFDENIRIPEIVLKPHSGIPVKLMPRY